MKRKDFTSRMQYLIPFKKSFQSTTLKTKMNKGTPSKPICFNNATQGIFVLLRPKHYASNRSCKETFGKIIVYVCAAVTEILNN